MFLLCKEIDTSIAQRKYQHYTQIDITRLVSKVSFPILEKNVECNVK